MERIVVGVDGSAASRKGLSWAAGLARLTGAAIEAVYAYDYTPRPDTYLAGPEGFTMPRPDFEAVAEDVRSRAEEALRGVLEEELGTADGLEVTPIVIEDRHPAHALVEQSKGADLLVLGTRGRGGFAGLLLGSISQQCTHHAPCPVVVVPPNGLD